jgi:peptide/nickel transport system substrate-binding protein
MGQHEKIPGDSSLAARVSRRELLKRSVVAGLSLPVVASLVAACVDTDDDDDEPAVEPEPTGDADEEPADEPVDEDEDEDEVADDDEMTASQGGSFALPVIDNPQIWPVVGGQPNILVTCALFSKLIKFNDPDLLPIGDLAEDWDVSEDGLEWTFNLKTNALWHDGEPVTADDVVFTANGVWVNPDIAYFLRGNLGMIREAEKVDDHSVVFHLHQPAYSFPWMVGYLASILPEHLLGEWEPDQFTDPREFTSNPVGSGAFKFAEAVPGSHVRLVRNDDYYDGAPHLDEVLYRVISDVEQQLAQLLTGELDIVVVEPHQVEVIEEREDIKIQEIIPVNYTYIAFSNRMEPFTDPLVRQALTYAIDREAIFENAQLGRGRIANHPISPALEWAFHDGVEGFSYDPERAAELLDEAGWTMPDGGTIRDKDGEPLRVVLEIDRGNPVREQTAIFAQQYWQEVGVDAVIESSQFNDLLSRVRGGDNADVQAFVMWFITPPHPDITAYYGCGQSTNVFFYCNEQVDELLAEARRTEDLDSQVELYREIQELIAEDAPVVFLYHPAELHALNASVQGWPGIGHLSGDAMTHIQNVWKE